MTDKKLTDNDVLKYLLDNPRFLELNPDAIDLLIPSGGKGEKGLTTILVRFNILD